MGLTKVRDRWAGRVSAAEDCLLGSTGFQSVARTIYYTETASLEDPVFAAEALEQLDEVLANLELLDRDSWRQLNAAYFSKRAELPEEFKERLALIRAAAPVECIVWFDCNELSTDLQALAAKAPEPERENLAVLHQEALRNLLSWVADFPLSRLEAGDYRLGYHRDLFVAAADAGYPEIALAALRQAKRRASVARVAAHLPVYILDKFAFTVGDVLDEILMKGERNPYSPVFRQATPGDFRATFMRIGERYYLGSEELEAEYLKLGSRWSRKERSKRLERAKK